MPKMVALELIRYFCFSAVCLLNIANWFCFKKLPQYYCLFGFLGCIACIAYMWPIDTDVYLLLFLSVCMLGMLASPAKTDKLIEVTFGRQMPLGPQNNNNKHICIAP